MRVKEFVPLVVLLARHAVGAAEVAPVHDGYAQVTNWAGEGVSRAVQGAERDDDFGFGHDLYGVYHRAATNANMASEIDDAQAIYSRILGQVACYASGGCAGDLPRGEPGPRCRSPLSLTTYGGE